MPEPSLDELRMHATYARDRLALYRRRIYVGRGDPRRLAELERESAGATARLHRALAAADPGPDPAA